MRDKGKPRELTLVSQPSPKPSSVDTRHLRKGTRETGVCPQGNRT
jgi:hypothetical protein